MYELTYIVNPLLEKTDADAAANQVLGLINTLGGEVKKFSLSAKRRFSYPIKKQQTGYLAVALFELESEKLPELEKSFRLNNDILRFLIITLKPSDLIPPKPLPARLRTATITSSPLTKPAGEIIKEAKEEKVKIEELDKKLEELLKE